MKFDESKTRIYEFEIPDEDESSEPLPVTNVPVYESYKKVKPLNKKRRIHGLFSYLVARCSAISMANGIGFTHDTPDGQPLPTWEGVCRSTSDSIIPKVPLLWYHKKCWMYTDYDRVCLSGTGLSGPWRGEFKKVSPESLNLKKDWHMYEHFGTKSEIDAFDPTVPKPGLPGKKNKNHNTGVETDGCSSEEEMDSGTDALVPPVECSDIGSSDESIAEKDNRAKLRETIECMRNR